ncbi:MAG: DUF5667 domain-containing protein [Patescibacteria group bacterium]
MGEKSETIRTWGSLRAAAFGSVAAVFLGSLVLMVSLLAISPSVVSPHETPGLIGEVDKVEYYLPYPGVLPDSPLYKLKAVRDKVLLLVILDPEKKADKQLFLADKRINAAQALHDGGKVDLAISVATKAEKYMESSVKAAVKLASEGKDVKSILYKQTMATLKHIELLNGFKAKSEGAQGLVLEQTIAEVDALHKLADQALIESK